MVICEFDLADLAAASIIDGDTSLRGIAQKYLIPDRGFSAVSAVGGLAAVGSAAVLAAGDAATVDLATVGLATIGLACGLSA